MDSLVPGGQSGNKVGHKSRAGERKVHGGPGLQRPSAGEEKNRLEHVGGEMGGKRRIQVSRDRLESSRELWGNENNNRAWKLRAAVRRCIKGDKYTK